MAYSLRRQISARDNCENRRRFGASVWGIAITNDILIPPYMLSACASAPVSSGGCGWGGAGGTGWLRKRLRGQRRRERVSVEAATCPDDDPRPTSIDKG